jgi:hypothetical protein
MTIQSNFGLWYSGTYIPFVCDISGVTTGQTTVITTAVDHGFVVGNQVQFYIPREWGITQLNKLKGYVLSLTDDTIEVNIDSTQFNQFSTPTVILPNIVQTPQVIPIGDGNTGYQYVGCHPPLKIPGTYRNTYP